MKTISFTISLKSFQLLQAIHLAGYAEFRDHNVRSFEDYKKTNDFIVGGRTEESFKKRNFCDIQDLDELIENHLIDHDYDAHHVTFVVTDFGKKALLT